MNNAGSGEWVLVYSGGAYIRMTSIKKCAGPDDVTIAHSNHSWGQKYKNVKVNYLATITITTHERKENNVARSKEIILMSNVRCDEWVLVYGKVYIRYWKIGIFSIYDTVTQNVSVHEIFAMLC